MNKKKEREKQTTIKQNCNACKKRRVNMFGYVE